ncbi:MAG: translation elongation factor Ts [Actinomycetota bacterium]|nr:translation elongation factor Ts [Actinomycetota bacterium]
MAKVSAADVKALRDRTGAGMMDCKQALEESGGDADKALEVLRRKGAASAEKRSGRGTGEGYVASYTHATGRVGVLVELRCETDFVARNEEFQAFAREIAVHVAAMYPTYVGLDDVPADVLSAESQVHEEKAKAEGKPENVVGKIVEGQMRKWASEPGRVLLEQPHFNSVKYDGKTIEQLRTEIAAKTGENVQIGRFARIEVGAEE